MKGQPLKLPYMLLLSNLIGYFLNLFLILTRPIKPQAKKSINAIVDTGPIFIASQLIPTTGNKLTRTITRRVACSAMKLATDGEYL
jgi:hypothetical protein